MKSFVFRKRQYINFPMLLRVIGWLLMIEACFMTIPLITGFIMGDRGGWAFLISIIITLFAGVVLMGLHPKTRDMGRREAILLTGLTWVILSMFGMLPFLISGTHLSFTDAFFETMSGFTTTGVSVLSTLEGVPSSILLWRCIEQWIGGLGIILFTLAVVPMLNTQGGMLMFNAEVTGITHDKLRPRVSYTAKSLWLIYIILTALLVVLLAFSDMDFFDALCYGLSTMSTGGFATTDRTVADLHNLYIKIVMTIFMMLGGISFTLLYKLAYGQFREAFRNDALKMYLYFIAGGYLLLTFSAWLSGRITEWDDVLIDPLFQAVSIISSTGISEPDFSLWGPLASIVTVLMMLVGACAGSTSGGAKIDRILILFRFLKNEFYRLMHPSSVTTVCINGRGTSYLVVQRVLAFLFLYILVIVGASMVLSVIGVSVEDSFYSVACAISNAGMGDNPTGILIDYSVMPKAAKWILAGVMLIGRLEIFTILLLFTSTFWRK